MIGLGLLLRSRVLRGRKSDSATTRKSAMAIQLGSLVRDTITGFEVVATCRSEYIFGCVRITVTPNKMHEGRPVDDCWFDEQRIEVIAVMKPSISAASSADTGGPQTVKPPSRW